jgi:hypothetical protein
VEGRYPAGIVAISYAGPETPFWSSVFADSTEGEILRRALARPFAAMSLYLRSDGTSGEGERLVICETDAPDLAAVLREVRSIFSRAGDSAAAETDFSVHRRVGPQFRTGDGKAITGILTVGTRCTDPAREDEFNEWYNGMHVLDQLGSGCYHTAYRYEAFERPGEYLAIYETDAPDPNEPSERILRHFRPKWAAEGRWTDLIEVTSRAAYSKVA